MMITLPLKDRLVFVRTLASISFLAGISFSFNLWIPDRFFPLIPVVDLLAFKSHFIHYFFSALLILLLIANVIFDKKLISLLLILVLITMLLQDQNRWQPWVYTYFLLLLPFGTRKKIDDQNVLFLPYFQIIIIGIYGWSGIHKLNSNFIDGTFYQILTQFFSLEHPDWITAIKPFGYLIPAIEIAIALALFFPRLRNVGVYAALITHLFILFYLSPLGINDNSVVYPWNLAIAGLVFLLFFNVTGLVEIWNRNISRIYNAVALLLIWIIPILNFFGLWDNYLSFSLYSGKINAFYIAVEDEELGKIDERLSQYFLHIEGLQGGKIIDVNEWAVEELNVPFYTETRNLKKIGQHFCKLGIPDDKLYFLEFELPFEKGRFKRFTCKEVAK